MKKSIFSLLLSFAMVAAFVVSCSDDDGDPTPVPTCSDGEQNGDETGVDCGGSCDPCVTTIELTGDVTEDTTLEASGDYLLTGGYVVKAGASLTIPAGTTIKASGGTAAFIGVERGAQIFINGTASSPVVMTSNATTPAQGDWGGLVIAGNAPTNKGVDITTEVGDLTYGGTAADDNSGSIKYLRVEYTGATFSNDKEFNGVSLFGVGSETTFEYVQSYMGGDDGIEFFGGTVDGEYLVSIGSGDDSIDFADGWQGNGSNWYIAEGAKAGIEGSNNGDNGDAEPVTTTTLSNITVVGPVSEGALFFKEGGGNFTIDNFFVSGCDLGVNVKDSDTEANTRIDNDNLAITNIQFADTPTGFAATNYAGTNTDFYTEGVATGAGNGAASPDWASGWTTGLPNSNATQQNLAGEVTGAVELDASIEYLLTSGFVVKAGGSLTIPAGTTIKASGGTASFIGVERGAQIFINGTASSPVVMTSNADTPAQGDWGGLVIAGDAPTNKGANITTEVGDLTYGGSNAADNSGSITYLRVEYTGATFSNDKEFNGVSLFGVGSETTFEFVQSYMGGDDGIEFFGGTVDGEYLVSIGSGDDSIDFADGWQGNGSNWYIANGAKAGIEGSNNGDNGNATPVTTTTLSNITVVGPVSEGALFFKEGGGNFTIDNFFVSGCDLGVNVKDTDTEANTRIDNDNLAITNIQFADTPTGFAATNYAGTNSDFYTEGVATGAGKGAAAPTWADGWTVGLPDTQATQQNLAGEVTGAVELDASIEYLLTSGFVVKAGGSLTIPAGTTIKASGGTASFIGVERGAQIFINGEANSPVIMTSNSDTPAQGDWGGLVIAGDAPTNKGSNITTEVGDLTYGGSNATDNSGSIRYLRVEYTGATFSNDKEFNGVSLFGVGSETTFEYVQSYMGGDDGIEFFGGTVSGDYLISIGSGDDSIDFADGWQGNGSNWYIAGGAKAGIEGSNNGDNGDATPVTTTTLTNITVVGPVTEGALFFKEGGGNFTISNFYTSGIDLGIKVTSTDTPAITRIDNDNLAITNIQFDAPATGFTATDYAGTNTDFYTEGTTTGAGNGAAQPDWATGWSTGF